MLKLRPDTRSGGGGGGGGGVLSVSGPIRKAGEGRGAVGFWPDTKSGGGGGGVLSVSGPIRKAGGGGGGGGECCRFLARYEKRGRGGVLLVSGPIRKAGEGGGGGAVGLWPNTGAYPECVLEEGAEKLARAQFLATTPILETEGGARAP